MKVDIKAGKDKEVTKDQSPCEADVAMVMCPSLSAPTLSPVARQSSLSTTSRASSSSASASTQLAPLPFPSNATSSLPLPAAAGSSAESGWLHKWTNYLKGYRQRWFVLEEGAATLSYFRSRAEVGRTCRGVVNLRGASILADGYPHFVVSAGCHVFHLKAASQADWKRWIQRLNQAKSTAIRAAESDEEEELKFESAAAVGKENACPVVDGCYGSSSANEQQQVISLLKRRLDELTNCHDVVARQSTSLQKSLVELETLLRLGDEGDGVEAATARLRLVAERAALFKVTATTMLRGCADFVETSAVELRRLDRLLNFEHGQRLQLQDQIEQLAAQHSQLENAVATSTAAAPCSESEEEDLVFHDACEHVTTVQYGLGMEEDSEFRVEGEEMVDEDEEEETTGSSEVSSVSNGQEQQQQMKKTRSSSSTVRRARVVTRSSCVEPVTPTVERRDGEGVGQQQQEGRQRRRSIPPRPSHSLNLWSFLRNCIGKELTRIAMPVQFNEPLSVLQRVTENLEYAELLDRAAAKTNPLDQLCLLAAFIVSSYATTSEDRATKPFNPLLGETYEADRRDDLGWRSLAEQVSHHPPTMAHHAEGADWIAYQQFTMMSKFRGAYLSVTPEGIAHCDFKSSGQRYSWKKVTTTVHNIIVGRLWIDNHGESVIRNHTTGDKCTLKFIPYSYFRRNTARRVSGVVQDKRGKVHWVIQGSWDKHIDALKVVVDDGGETLETLAPRRLWNARAADAGAPYNFSRLAIELNEEEEGVAPTDSRLRPDQRLLEVGRLEEAEKKKAELEERQRLRRRRGEAETHQPRWFTPTVDRFNGGLVHLYAGDYWQCKETQDWQRCPTQLY